MKPETVVAVQKSFKAVVPIADEVGRLFYARLFENHPELRPLFADDIEHIIGLEPHRCGVIVGVNADDTWRVEQCAVKKE